MTCAGRSETCWNQSWKRGTIRRFLGSFDYQDSWIMIFPQNDPIGKFAREIIGTNPFTPGWRLCWTRDGTITLRDTILQGETSNLVADWRFHPLWDSTEKKNQCNHLYFYIMWIYIYIHWKKCTSLLPFSSIWPKQSVAIWDNLSICLRQNHLTCEYCHHVCHVLHYHFWVARTSWDFSKLNALMV